MTAARHMPFSTSAPITEAERQAVRDAAASVGLEHEDAGACVRAWRPSRHRNATVRYVDVRGAIDSGDPAGYALACYAGGAVR